MKHLSPEASVIQVEVNTVMIAEEDDGGLQGKGSTPRHNYRDFLWALRPWPRHELRIMGLRTLCRTRAGGMYALRAVTATEWSPDLS